MSSRVAIGHPPIRLHESADISERRSGLYCREEQTELLRDNPVGPQAVRRVEPVSLAWTHEAPQLEVPQNAVRVEVEAIYLLGFRKVLMPNRAPSNFCVKLGQCISVHEALIATESFEAADVGTAYIYGSACWVVSREAAVTVGV